jgi:preprotein translocase subunit SecD
MTSVESQLTAALADTARRNLPDATVPPPFRQPAAPESPRRIRPWALPALAAAVVVAVTVSAVALANRGRPATHQVPAGTTSGSFVTLRAQRSLSAAELDRARQILIARAVALGAKGGEVQVVGTQEITLSLPGVVPADVGDLGAPYALQFRPMITNSTVRAVSPSPSPSPESSSASRRVVDQWKSLGFPPPKDIAAYIALSPAQQHAVQVVLKNWDCRNAPLDLPGAPIVACDQTHTNKYLLGAAIVPSDQFQSASVTSPGQRSFGWGVDVHLKAAGDRQWTDYTSQHNEDLHPGDTANVVADVLDGDVLVASTIESPIIAGYTEIAPDLTERTATRLAGFLSAGVLPAPFDVTSMRSN